MHRLMAGVTILEHELSELRLLVERQTGILLDCPNSALAAHVAEYLESQELESPAALLDRLRPPIRIPPRCRLSRWRAQREYRILSPSRSHERAGSPGDSATLCPQIGRRTLHATHLERRLRHRRRGLLDCDGPVRTAARTGNGNGQQRQRLEQRQRQQEKPKKAAAQRRHRRKSGCRLWQRKRPKDWSIHIVGSDLLPSAIEVAERGLYPQSALTGLPPAAIRACFSKIGSPNGNERAQERRCNDGLSETAAMHRQWIEQRLSNGSSKRRAPAGQAAPAQPGHLQHHEPDQAGLHRPLRLHLLHGRAAASLPRPAHRPASNACTSTSNPADIFSSARPKSSAPRT